MNYAVFFVVVQEMHFSIAEHIKRVVHNLIWFYLKKILINRRRSQKGGSNIFALLTVKKRAKSEVPAAARSATTALNQLDLSVDWSILWSILICVWLINSPGLLLLVMVMVVPSPPSTALVVRGNGFVSRLL